MDLSCSVQSGLARHRPFVPRCANRACNSIRKVSRQLTYRRPVRYSSPADERTKGTTGMKLPGQVAVITGAGRNIGKAMAKLFAAEGAKIAVIEMHEGRGKAVVDEINETGREAMLVLCDVANSRDVQAMVNQVVARFGGIDILVNNAALTDHANIFESTEEEFDKVIAVSLKGPYLVTKYIAAQMVKQGRGGKIVNFGSTSGMIGRADGIAYAAAKAGGSNSTRELGRAEGRGGGR